jgi:hypothetical protein
MMKKYIRDGSLLWLGLVLCVALCIAFLLPVTPEDYWWYLRVGQQTLASGMVPATDTFTYTIAGQALYYHSWGAAVLFWLLYRVGGLSLTVLIRALVVLITYTIVWVLARSLSGGRITASLVLLLTVLASCNNWAIRPQLFTYPLFALSLLILYRWQAGSKKVVWALPLIALVWGNLHGSYLILFALMGAALLFGKGERRGLLLAFLAAALAICVNPRGLGSWQYALQMVVSPANQQLTKEWGPPVNSGWQMHLFFLWLLAFPLLAVFSKRRLSALEWCWFAGFGLMALSGLRYGIWFLLVLAVLTSQLLADWELQWLPERPGGNFALNLIFPILMVLASLALLPGLRETWWKQSPPVTSETPLAATAWLKDHPELKGPLFSEMGFASYLEFALPERPVWIDSRVSSAFPYPDSMWNDYREIESAAWDWSAKLDATGANLLMVSPTIQPKLIAALQHSAGWCKVYNDHTAQIYTRGVCKP